MQLETEIQTNHGTIQPIKELKNKVFKFNNEKVVTNFDGAMMINISVSYLEKCIKHIEQNFKDVLDVSLIKYERIALKKMLEQ